MHDYEVALTKNKKLLLFVNRNQVPRTDSIDPPYLWQFVYYTGYDEYLRWLQFHHFRGYDITLQCELMPRPTRILTGSHQIDPYPFLAAPYPYVKMWIDNTPVDPQTVQDLGQQYLQEQYNANQRAARSR